MRSIQTFETLPRTYIPASDRILWLWLILTESELWRTLAESLLRKVIPIRTIVSAPSRAKDMALSMHKRYRCCPTPALTLTTMVLLNVAATRGPAALWPGYRMRNFAPALTLRQVAEQILPADHAEISRVEGRPKMDSSDFSDLTEALDCGVGDIFKMGVSAMKFFLRFDDEPAADAAAEETRSIASVLIAAEKARSRCCYCADVVLVFESLL